MSSGHRRFIERAADSGERRVLLALTGSDQAHVEQAARCLSERFGFDCVYSLHDAITDRHELCCRIALRSLWGTEACTVHARGGIVVHVKPDISQIMGNLLGDVDVCVGDYVLINDDGLEYRAQLMLQAIEDELDGKAGA